MFSYFDKVEAYDTPRPDRRIRTRSRPRRTNARVAAGPAVRRSLPARAVDVLPRRRRVQQRRRLPEPRRPRDARAAADHAALREQPAHAEQRPATAATAAASARTSTTTSRTTWRARAYRSSTARRRSTRRSTICYCHDNRVNDLSWCTQSDAGESFQEVVDHYRLGWLQRYPQVYFRNYRAAGPARGYSQNSVVDAVKIYQHLFFRYNYEGAAFRNSTGPLGYHDQLFASADVIELARPRSSARPTSARTSSTPTDKIYRQVSTDPNDRRRRRVRCIRARRSTCGARIRTA